MPVSTHNQPNALKRALLLDATASGGMGLILVLAAAPLVGVLGLPLDLLRYVGVFLVPFAGLLVWIATRRVVPLGLVAAVVIGNLLWVVASVALLLSGWANPTVLGEVFVLAQAAAVLLFAYLEFTAVRALARWQHTAPNN
jgi:hypothetical protein